MEEQTSSKKSGGAVETGTGCSLLSQAPMGPTPPQEESQPSLAVLLCLPTDAKYLTSSSCLLRKQIEVFSSSIEDISIQHTRYRPIVVGAVAIRCIHCRHVPRSQRARGAVIFPSTIKLIYQSVRNFQRYVVTTCFPNSYFSCKMILQDKSSYDFNFWFAFAHLCITGITFPLVVSSHKPFERKSCRRREAGQGVLA